MTVRTSGCMRCCSCAYRCSSNVDIFAVCMGDRVMSSRRRIFNLVPKYGREMSSRVNSLGVKTNFKRPKIELPFRDWRASLRRRTGALPLPPSTGSFSVLRRQPAAELDGANDEHTLTDAHEISVLIADNTKREHTAQRTLCIQHSSLKSSQSIASPHSLNSFVCFHHDRY